MAIAKRPRPAGHFQKKGTDVESRRIAVKGGRYFEKLGIKDPHRMSKRQKRAILRWRTEVKKSSRQRKGKRQKQRSGKIIPLSPGLIPKHGKVIELPEGKFRYRTVITLLAPMPKKKYKHKWSRELNLLEAADGFKGAVKIKAVVDFSPEFFPGQPAPYKLKGEIDAATIKELEKKSPLSDSVLKSWGVGPELKQAIKNGGIEGIQVMHQPSVPDRKYYHSDKMWLVRTPDGVPVGISLHGGFIEGSDWFRKQLVRIIHGVEPEEKLCKIYVTDPGLLKSSSFVEHIPFYKEPPKRENRKAGLN